MNRRSFLLTASAAGIVACTAPSSSDDALAGREGPVQLEAYIIDAQTTFRGTGQPYLNALSQADIDRPSQIDWLVLPSYGRATGAIVGGAMVAVADRRTTLEAFFAGLPPSWQLPPSHALRFGKDRWPDASEPPRWGARVVRIPPVVESTNVLRVEAEPDVLTVYFDRDGTTRMEVVTERNIGQRMAIVVDDEIVSDPIINEAIPGGRVQITLDDAGPEDYQALQQRFMG